MVSPTRSIAPVSDLINKFDKLYVGQRPQGGNNPLPLAFITPYEENAAGKKRIETVDRWADDLAYEMVNGKWTKNPNTLKPTIIDNVPLAGFSIAKSVRRDSSWNGGNVVWRIEDPRGFEWEISSPNLAQILTQTGIAAGGIINGRCIIGRLAGANILVPEGTDLWDKMEADLVKREVKATQKNVTGYNIGDRVKTKADEEFYFIGKEKVMLKVYDDPDMNAKIQRGYYSRSTPTFKLQESEHEYFLFTRVDEYNISANYFPTSAYKNNPVVEVLPDEPLDATIIHTIRNNKLEKTYISFSGKPKEASTEIHGFI
jgi:hypothetical protein